MDIIYDLSLPIPPIELPDLPMTASMCANCGQLLDSREIIGLDPESYPKGHWDPRHQDWDEVEWAWYCPRCHIELSDKPPHNIIIVSADTYPTIEELIKEKDHLQKLIAQHKYKLHIIEEQLAMAGALATQRAQLMSLKDFEQEEISTLKHKLHTVEEEIQSKFARL